MANRQWRLEPFFFSMSIGVLGLCASVAQADAETTQVPAVSAESKNGWDQGKIGRASCRERV